MPTHQKATNRSATSIYLRRKIVFDSNLAYLDHSLPPLGLFLKSNSFSYVLVKHTCLGIKRDNQREKLIYYFQNSHVVADPFALAINFSPFGIKHQNGIIFGPQTPLRHQKMSMKIKKAIRAWR
jgi:hypothetical protein